MSSLINLLTLNVFNKLELDKKNLTKIFYPLVGLEDKIKEVGYNHGLSFVDGVFSKEA